LVSADLFFPDTFLEWAPPNKGWRRGSLYRGDGEGFLVHGEKKGEDREVAGDGFILYLTTFLGLGRGSGSC
jgi:hypothetical protein